MPPEAVSNPRPLADVANEPLPASARENPGADLDGQVAAVLAAGVPLGDVSLTREQLLSCLREAFDLVGQNRIDDRLADDLVARVTEHPAARAVDVGVTARRSSTKMPSGASSISSARPRVVLLQGDVDAVERQATRTSMTRVTTEVTAARMATWNDGSPAPTAVAIRVTAMPSNGGSTSAGITSRSHNAPGASRGRHAHHLPPRGVPAASRPTTSRRATTVGSAMPIIDMRIRR